MRGVGRSAVLEGGRRQSDEETPSPFFKRRETVCVVLHCRAEAAVRS